MKYITFMAFIISTSFAHAQSQTDLASEIENRIANLRNNTQTKLISKNIEVRAKTTLLKEKNLLEGILNGYDHLKKYSVTYRYEYMHKALQAVSSDLNVKNQKLTTWLEEVNRELLSRKLHEKFSNEWKSHYKNLKQAIHESNTTLESVSFSEPVAINYNDEINFLVTINQQLAQSATPTLAPVESATESNSAEYIFNVSAGILMLLGGILIFRRPKTKIIYRPVTVKAKSVEEAPLALDGPIELAETQYQEQEQSNLEASYIECLKRNEHLIKQAELKVLNAIKSPFRSNIAIPQERLDQALNFLLQGTLAVANTSSTKASHMEWNCIDQGGRYSLNLILHGVNCDEKNLFLNTLIDTDFSGPAYFGRAEQTLEEHQPTVLFKSHEQRTTISLSLDNFEANSFQSH